jgi:hypothetical protein
MESKEASSLIVTGPDGQPLAISWEAAVIFNLVGEEPISQAMANMLTPPKSLG